ncbi:MarR family winged helix-turn-helix transcriptional regulator [Mangrovibrevibacter kandeliae]|uniref:MarR family winged helix-turn-helix transcriptional regulator n=1 Tax=Mangrovibrevibacter kandeliae TaxID=2968473 RepID=UPI002118EC78|nr:MULTISPECIES: MarR family winged helix-turn-helix transcriptional regulator [unclassified Aurantimonas]MCQ8783546.1 MarR family winged helix-turn-helix transcriptional regulator [Aurantimonas sp. CSK15Z-1]MCW4115941.1 MarR family winged helix-turn-helix transcriptional regulator [Aurantimonas sp. MSK8Z-1]
MREKQCMVEEAPITADAEVMDIPSTGGTDMRLVTSLLSIAKSTRAFLTLLLAEIDLHPGQDQLLNRLEPGEPVSVSALADQLSVRPSTVSKMLDRLIEKQLVIRAANSRDARRTMVMLTPAGERAKHAVTAIWNRLEIELGNSLSEEDLSTISSALEQADQLLSGKLRRLR